LEPSRRRGRSDVVGIRLRDQGCVASKEGTVSTVSVHRFEHAVDKDCIKKRGKGTALGNPALYREGLGEASVNAYPRRATLIQSIHQAPQLACHTFVSKAVQKSMVHHPIINLAPVEEEEACEPPCLYARANCSI
jgi:hypothetical protein